MSHNVIPYTFWTYKYPPSVLFIIPQMLFLLQSRIKLVLWQNIFVQECFTAMTVKIMSTLRTIDSTVTDKPTALASIVVFLFLLFIVLLNNLNSNIRREFDHGRCLGRIFSWTLPQFFSGYNLEAKVFSNWNWQRKYFNTPRYHN